MPEEVNNTDTVVEVQEQRAALEEETRPLFSSPEEEEEEEGEQQQEQPRTTTTRRRNVSKLETVGLFIIVLGAFAHSCSSAVVKWSVSSFPTFEIVFAQSIFQIVFGLFGCLWLREKPLGPPGARRWVIVCGVFGTLATSCFYYSLTYLPLGETTVIFYLYPILTLTLAGLFLQETFGWFDTLATVLCLLGALFISKPYIFFGSSKQYLPPLHKHGNITNIAAMMCAFFTSCVYYAMHQAKNHTSSTTTTTRQTHFLSILFVMGCFLFLFSVPIGLFGFQEFVQPSSGSDYLKLVSVGLTTFCHQCLVYLGLRLAPTSLATMILCGNDIVFSFIFGTSLFKEDPDIFSIVGTFLMVFMTSAVAINKWNNNK
ncbi:EamA-like transporter family-domain-containing protein [Phascolomyces articulosus]|uniref:EamA-like transporter family-domain-containing protein n=1 Tax=Phascolomyces articulosus TaxID=60185 RepID=A0AAD5KBG5_9FUNG|nr:EamA-like transporter family-domain-containing protein [Phascolomyces articulosus]